MVKWLKQTWAAAWKLNRFRHPSLEKPENSDCKFRMYEWKLIDGQLVRLLLQLINFDNKLHKKNT